MEAIAAFGLVGLGYLVTKLSKTNEGYQDNQVSPLQNTQQGNSIKSSNQELGLRYATPFGQVYPSEPNPGPQGSGLIHLICQHFQSNKLLIQRHHKLP